MQFLSLVNGQWSMVNGQWSIDFLHKYFGVVEYIVKSSRKGAFDEVVLEE
jgi:hypothetical protein